MSFAGNSHLSGIKVNGSKENPQFSFRNLHKLGPRAAEKLARAGIKVSLIELKSCEFLRKLARAGIKVSLIELKGCEFPRKLAPGGN